MINNSFLSEKELYKIGFSSIGEDVKISRYARFYRPEKMKIGSNVRIDDFCILSGKVELKNNIHISAYSALYGGNAGIFFDDYSGASARCTIFAASDDFSGGYLANSVMPIELRNVIEKEVFIGKYVQLGAGSELLPGVTIGEGSCTGSMTLVNKSLDEWGIYVGVPCRFLKPRKKIDVL